MSDDLRTTRDYERAAAETLVYLPKLIADEFGCSRSEGRRLLCQGAVKLEGEELGACQLEMARSTLAGRTLTVGTRRSVQL